LIIRGIDTLEYGLDIEDYEEALRPLLERFKLLKEEGQKYGITKEMELNGVYLTVEKNGMPFYPYRLTCKDFSIGFVDKRNENNPDIKVKMMSGFLWSLKAKQAYETIIDWLSGLGVKIIRSRISRLDICVDTDKARFVPADIEGFVTRASAKVKHYVSDEYQEGRYFSGITIGRGKPLLCRIYDKSREIKKSGKVWFYPLWMDSGWDWESTVWRVEFQLRRKALKELGIDSVEDLWSKEESLWSYLTGEWLQLKTPNKDNVSRWPEKRKWTLIRKAQSGYEASPLVRKQVKQGDAKRLLDQGSGILFSLGAVKGCDSIEKALELLRQHGEGKLRKENIDFRAKMSQRRRKYINGEVN